MTMNHQFKDVEKAFLELKGQFANQEISRRELIERLKRLRIRDEQGRFWMIGAQSGKWYYFDGKDWVRSDLPSQAEKKEACPHCGFTNSAGIVFCEGCGESLRTSELICPACGRMLDDPGRPCPYCSREEEAVSVRPLEPESEPLAGRFIIRRLDPLSLVLFGGCFGVVFGIIFGAFAGSTAYFAGIAGSLPPFLRDLQGTLMGGIICAATGAILGFVAFGLLGGLAALLFNITSSFVGGINLTLEKKNPGKSGGEGEDESV